MSVLKRTVFLIVACIIVASCAGVIYALFHGYFDGGLFEIKESQWSSSGQVAMVAERSDRQALSSDVYFVLIGDHVFNASELRRAYHSESPVFAAGNDCLRVSWSGPNNLVVRCRDSVVRADEIDRQRHQAGDIAIAYLNIPDIAAGSAISDKK